MNFTLDIQKQGTSMTGFILVVALHLALLSALIFGLKLANMPPTHVDDVIYVSPKTEPPKPIEPLEKVKLRDPVMPVITPPNYPVPTDTFIPVTTTPEQPTGSKGGIDSGSTEHSVADVKPAALFVGAVVDAKSCDKPEYPRNALRNEYTGVVTLALLIGLDGKVIDAKVEQTSGHKELDQAALAGLSLCKFKPATLNGQAQKSWAKLQYAWNVAE
ncbi:energy transducer TonB [Solimicrobium silvestre]|uniref:TonB family C-terminal domain n=1 Tax=Solimicrobium silvestre TaxID=2099400 RepID=A0A2S9GY50_9BURK|nr:energy transducer TonB [Solimicrobium silvestre]PRC92586.1 TonB family C-terminal domain [Solimicrobium silvestre]